MCQQSVGLSTLLLLLCVAEYSEWALFQHQLMNIAFRDKVDAALN